RFDGLLAELCAELALLREHLRDDFPLLRGPIARRMAQACWPHRENFITPMAAVAGAVAEAVLAAMVRSAPLARAYVNNGATLPCISRATVRSRLGSCARSSEPCRTVRWS